MIIGNAYPTVRCRHCGQLRCFPGKPDTCYGHPASHCPAPTVPPGLGYEPYLSGDGLMYWDRDVGKWKNVT